LYVTKAGDVRTNIIAMFIWSVVLVNTNLQNRDVDGYVTLFCGGLLNIAIEIIPADIVSKFFLHRLVAKATSRSM
jgi:hypothetical protein